MRSNINSLTSTSVDTGLAGANQSATSQPSPRGVKRGRSPGEYGDGASIVKEENGTMSSPLHSITRTCTDASTAGREAKRGKPKATDDSPASQKTSQSSHPVAGPVRTPQLKAQSLPQTSPPQSSPPKSTPSKGAVLKALPTVRDHTTDQLNPEGDEYIPREYDDAGEKKVSPMGDPLGGREYRCRTFLVPNRGNKLFMLATECARVLGYRDSYLLFNKNRSLYKIIATQPEKDDLINQDVLPYSYRSRQIAIVTARSMFRQFGSRLVKDGRRVRDDYWESKARKQGFTEEDAAGEKRPGGAKQREAAAAEASTAHQLTSLPHGEIIYSNGPIPTDHGIGPHHHINPTTLAPLPMINIPAADEHMRRDYSNIQRPRHEIAGAPAYHDRTTPSGAAEILNQSAQAAEFNKSLGNQRSEREQYMSEYWKRPHEVPGSPPRQGTVDGDNATVVSQTIQSPAPAPAVASTSQSLPPRAQPPPHLISGQSYPQTQHHPPTMQSPMHPMHNPLRPEQMHHRSPSMGMGSSGPPGQPAYGYPNSQMWPPQQPQPSPLGQHHNMQQYGQPPPQQQSPHPQQPQLHQSPQMHHAQSTGSMHGMPMGYPTAGGMNAPGYSGMGRSPYQPGANPQQFMHQSSAAQQPGMQGWAPQQGQQAQQPNWNF
ncbi:hypothetical protein EJ05DRAFT_187848 [Pseudovirgaria hyperparasitica]|uniref:RSC complex subunit Rsc7 n=1 Tax=Pseudovirgaria hyperparasitica TaxID=470096 RepID=A0A6A6WGG2_9PEZI|nr:uncharacterized protein EJ05DRAFT_187848 [Pseudovirgaria hyperparasitica]KAF2761873.1 hypothetical protein EJ05DRAFT_187848 [Pseudovirgaria hyperparasitica]